MRQSNQPVARVMTRAAVFALWLALVSGAAGGAGARAQDAQALKTGQDLFKAYCASCHGATGIGNGPAAMAMRRMPPDITGLALANGGVFPIDRIRRIVDGREVEAHGDREMPVWGDAFKALSGGQSDAAVRERIRAILEYLQSVQRRRA